MRILALETSSLTASVAAFEDEQLLDETAFDPPLRTAQSFAPAIARQLAAVHWRPADVQLIAVTVGPGSFTGLRVGVTAAKTLAYAVGAEVLGLNTLHVIAAQAPPQFPQLYAVLDAQREQLFAACFNRCGPDWHVQVDAHIVDNARWLACLTPDVAVTGAGLARVREQIPAGIHVLDPSLWTPRAATVGRLAGRAYHAGQRDDLWALVPRYYRQSAAEEKLQATSERAAP